MDAPSRQSSIESFSDDDIIIIVENRVKILKIIKFFFGQGGKNKNLIYPKYIIVEQMLKAN